MEKRYSTENIVWRKDVEHVRLRPAMYIGSRSSDGLHEVLRILLDSLAEEADEGHCTRIAVVLAADGSVAVEDDGRGIPVGRHGNLDETTLEIVFTRLGACYCGCEQAPGHRSLLHGVGVAVLTALSEWLEVETTRESRRYRMRFERGVPTTGLEPLGMAHAPGTRIRFLPEASIFDADARLNRVRLEEELRALATLTPGLTVTFRDERFSGSPVMEFRCPEGLADLAHVLTEAPRLARAIVGRQEEDWEDGTAEARLAIQIDASRGERMIGFANRRRLDEGTHMRGLIHGLDLGFKEAATDLGLPEITGRPPGLRGIVAVTLPFPEIEGFWERLANARAVSLVASVARRSVATWARENPEEARGLLLRRV